MFHHPPSTSGPDEHVYPDVTNLTKGAPLLLRMSRSYGRVSLKIVVVWRPSCTVSSLADDGPDDGKVISLYLVEP